jgi:chloramphenicol 3-O phosphotransferase
MARVILLTGPSCSGKTSLARAMQSQLALPVLHIEADRVFPRLPEAHPQWDAEARHHDVVLAFHRSIAVWAASGFDLIADGCLPYGMPALRSECLRVLGSFGMLLVGVRCAPAVLAERARARADRSAGWAVRQSRDVHDGLRLDAEVDTSSGTPEDCARRVICQLQNGPGWPAATGRSSD